MRESTSAYSEHARKDYEKRSKNLEQYMQRAVEENRDISGPRYKIQSSNGQELTFRTFIIPRTKESGGKELLVMLGINQKGDTVSQRVDFLDYTNGGINVTGDVVTKVREGGIGTAAELIHLHLLQSIANIKQQSLIYSVHDLNGQELDQMKTLVDTGYGNKHIYEKKLAERKRWERLYGENGILGFNTAQIRVFPPTPNENKSIFGENPATIYLERGRKYDSGRELAVPIAVRTTYTHPLNHFQHIGNRWLRQTIHKKAA